MLKKILSLEQCASCRNCCVFQEKSRWETPVVSEEKGTDDKKKIKNRKIVLYHMKKVMYWHLKRDKVLPKGQNLTDALLLMKKRAVRLQKMRNRLTVVYGR